MSPRLGRRIRRLARYVQRLTLRGETAYSRRRLRFVVTEVSNRIVNVRLRGLPEDLVPLLEVSGSLVRGCLDAARGVLAAAELDEYGGIVAAERSAWEMWNELDYLLRTDNAKREAIKVQVNGLLEIIELLADFDGAPPDMVPRNEEALARFTAKYPDVVDEVRNQRKKRRYHWSGQTRTSVVAPDESSRAVYKMLSWETHPDILAIRDISAEKEGDFVRLELSSPPSPDPFVERSANSTSECLLRSWNAFAQAWDLEELKNVPPRKSG